MTFAVCHSMPFLKKDTHNLKQEAFSMKTSQRYNYISINYIIFSNITDNIIEELQFDSIDLLLNKLQHVCRP